MTFASASRENESFGGSSYLQARGAFVIDYYQLLWQCSAVVGLHPWLRYP
jgi:hypothetical protein